MTALPRCRVRACLGVPGQCPRLLRKDSPAWLRSRAGAGMQDLALCLAPVSCKSHGVWYRPALIWPEMIGSDTEWLRWCVHLRGLAMVWLKQSIKANTWCRRS
jgi:hypothetical protein